jgi:dihydropteroate synthase
VKLTPLARRPAALAEALVRRGVPQSQADATAAGLSPATIVVDGVAEAERDTLATAARAHGAACLSGPGWLLLSGETACLAGLTRTGLQALPTDAADQLGNALQAVIDPPMSWNTCRGPLALDRPLVMGILNITPDSFSDGGRWLTPAAAMVQAGRLLDEGADLLDVGAESTRPGRPDAVPADEEWRRLAPVLTEVTRRFPSVPVSVDTVKSETAQRAVDTGAWIINDVSGLRLDPRIADVCAASAAGLILMHSRGTLAELATYDHAVYDDLLSDIAKELKEALSAAGRGGVPADRIAVDPGFGFGKRPEDNWRLLDRLDVLRALGHPLVVGPSRKRFLGGVTGRPPTDRDGATAAACVLAYERGAHVFRVHAAGPTREALDVAYAARTA